MAAVTVVRMVATSASSITRATANDMLAQACILSACGAIVMRVLHVPGN